MCKKILSALIVLAVSVMFVSQVLAADPAPATTEPTPAPAPATLKCKLADEKVVDVKTEQECTDQKGTIVKEEPAK